MTRRVKRDGSIYFGPYSNVRMMHTLLNLIKDLYSLRTCSFDLSDSKISSGKYKECLEFHIGNCHAPCIGAQTRESYQEEIDEIQQILNGNLVDVKKLLKIRMGRAAEGENFELAQKYKESLNSLEVYQSKSIVVSSNIRKIDVLTFMQNEFNIYYNYLHIKNGAIIHAMTGEADVFEGAQKHTILDGLLNELRSRHKSDAKDIITEKGFDLNSEEFIFHHPQRGEKKKLLDLSLKNLNYFALLQKRKTLVKPNKSHLQNC